MSLVKRLSENIAIELEKRYGIQVTTEIIAQIMNLISEKSCQVRFDSFSKVLRESDHSPLWQQIIEKVTIHETYFHRNPHGLKALKKNIQKIIDEKGSIRILSLPCSSGEEAYDIAFLAIEALFIRNTSKLLR